MAKSSMKAREDKRAKTVAKFAAKRDAIKVILNDVNTSEEDRWAVWWCSERERRQG